MKKIIPILVLVLVSVLVFGQNEIKRASQFNLENGIAIQGYDPISYFVESKAIKGNKEIAVTYKGVVYYFSSKKNKETFLKNPSSYEPQYGGWCAYAIGKSGEKVSVNPKTFKIVDGKLYLFYNAFLNNTLKDWNKDEANLKSKANENWDRINK
ncbi:YHS domain-containing (seleno)protein [Flavobacterium sp. NG2]|uniref:YHS domain-containing (seleno)protein n=1 Tax=Flavobacterium sp. NG2 TaxID=3097547 RepID=UPI002A838CF2|nr:YHS domain-containing (seleno)protein [Flavobacterium sp. NG2]WPR72661.1 YHS domain-containing (seleno)protein [Flavobacterium sp. NG2]